LNDKYIISDIIRKKFAISGNWNYGVLFKVRWREVDMLGHANHLTYLAYCEDVRNSYSQAIGLPAHGENALLHLIVSINAEYKESAQYDDDLLVTCRTEQIGRTSAIFGYAIWKNGCIFTASSKSILFSPRLKQKIQYSDTVKEKIRKIDPEVNILGSKGH